MKILYSFLFALSMFVLFPCKINAQSFISLSSGISFDVNNSNHSFYHIPVALQWKPSHQKKSPFLVEFGYDFPLTVKGTGNAYTLNPNLPQEVTLKENIRASVFTASIGFRIHLYTNERNNSFYVNIMPFGICAQNFKVNYKNYDKENYEVLDPDVNLNKGGFMMSMSGVYNFHKRKQDMMLMLHLQTPPFQNRGDYPLSYQFIAPLELTFGYNFYYNK